ncbi:helix-turn-helix domain-containing protein [Rathayibacter sp. CAU 1779]
MPHSPANPGSVNHRATSGDPERDVDTGGDTVHDADRRDDVRIPARAAEVLRAARQRSGLTQTELAQFAGVTQSVISAYESGHRDPSLTMLTKLVEAAGWKLEISLGAGTAASRRRPLAEIVHEHRDELIAAFAERGGRNLRLFGSAARGEDGPDSDVDLLVDLDEHVGIFDLAGMSIAAEKILGVAVDVAPANALKPRVAESALAEAIAV